MLLLPAEILSSGRAVEKEVADRVHSFMALRHVSVDDVRLVESTVSHISKLRVGSSEPGIERSWGQSLALQAPNEVFWWALP